MFRRIDANNDQQQSEEDKKWQMKVLGTAKIDDYEEDDFLDDNELETILRIFGIYSKKIVEPKFNSKHFVPARDK